MAGEITISPHPEGSLIDVWVVPGARRNEIVGSHDGALRVRVAALPEGGKANEAVTTLLEKTLGARGVYLERGARHRRKRFVIVAMAPADIRAIVGPED